MSATPHSWLRRAYEVVFSHRIAGHRYLFWCNPHIAWKGGSDDAFWSASCTYSVLRVEYVGSALEISGVK
jgi:hypothetical protein